MTTKLVTPKRRKKKKETLVETFDRGKSRKKIVRTRIEKTFRSKNCLQTTRELKRIVLSINPNTPCSKNTLNSLIDFTQVVHLFRKSHKKDLEFIAAHLGDLDKGPLGECIRIFNGEYQSIKVYFDSKNFTEKAFEKGVTITNGKTYTISELRKSENPAILEQVRGYMLRTTQLLEIMKSH